MFNGNLFIGKVFVLVVFEGGIYYNMVNLFFKRIFKCKFVQVVKDFYKGFL